MSSLLPIFPLELVLLPGVPLPLHIFEPRYKEMIAECLELKKPFGIVRASDEGVAEIGCTAEIVSVTKKYDDGRMDILTRGVERFEVIQVNEEREFLRELHKGKTAQHYRRPQRWALMSQPAPRQP